MPPCSEQFSLNLRPKGRGGAREGAGRKKTAKEAPHQPRPKLAKSNPIHITLRTKQDAGNLREQRRFQAIQDCFRAGKERFGFRLIHFSVQSTHIHLIAEAENEKSLARGMQGLKIRIAKSLNSLLDRAGAVFSERYHAHILKTPRETKNALAYVLLNNRHHLKELGKYVSVSRFDPCSSSEWFDGWLGGIPAVRAAGERAVAVAQSWLLRVGWRRWGLVDPAAVPGPQPRRSSPRPNVAGARN